MSEVQRIGDQLRRAYEGDAWHGPSVKEVLSGVTAAMAARKPPSGAHSIWEIAGHIGAWAEVARRRLAGETVNVTDSLNFPPTPATATEEAWQETLRLLDKRHHLLMESILNFPDSKLDEPCVHDDCVKEGPTAYVLLHGVVQHHIYHAGQIAILKKA